MKFKKSHMIVVCLLYVSTLTMFGLYLSNVMTEKTKSSEFTTPIKGIVDSLNKNSISLELSINNIISYLVNSEYVDPDEFNGITDALLFQHPQIKAIGHIILPMGVIIKEIEKYEKFQWNQNFDDERLKKKEITLTLIDIISSQEAVGANSFASDFVNIFDETGRKYTIVFNKIEKKNSYLFFVLNVEEFIGETLDQITSGDHSIFYDKQKNIKAFERRSGRNLTGEFYSGELLFYNRAWPIEIFRNRNNAEYFYFSIPFVTFLIGLLLAYFYVVLAKNKELSEYRNQALENLKFAQQKIIEAQKLNAMGALVAGVAHEINTPLGICITSSSHALDLVKELQDTFVGGSLDAEMLNEFIHSSIELMELSLSNLSRTSKLISSFKEIDVTNIIDSTRPEKTEIQNLVVDFIKSHKKYFEKNKIIFNTEFKEENSFTTLSAVLNNILLHLTKNVIAHAKKETESCVVHICVYSKDNKKYFRFSDDGMGADNLSRIIEPFYTTKRGAGHAGLGLSVVYNLVKSRLRSDLHFGKNSEKGLWFEFELLNLDEGIENE